MHRCVVFSRKLHAAETKCSTFDKELLAMYLAVTKFSYFIDGRQVTLFTDHLPLTFVYKKHFGQVVASPATTSLFRFRVPPTM